MRTRITQFLIRSMAARKAPAGDVGQVFLVSGLLEFIQPSAEVGFISSLSVAVGTPLL